MASERIQKLIARTGLLSRRKAEEAITSGRIRVNGKPVTQLGTKADPDVDQICLDGKPLRFEKRATVIALNKPLRTVTTKSDPEGRHTVMDLLPESLQFLKPVGRLDVMTEGLLLLTDDGDLANDLMHPSRGTRKIYDALVSGKLKPETLKSLTTRVELEDGPGRFEEITQLPGSATTQSKIRVIVSEGRNRFVRRMFEAVGHPVLELKRVAVGGLWLGDLPSGKFRKLSPDEIALAKSQTAKGEKS